MLEGRDPETMLRDLGKLVSEGWETKRRFSTSVTLPQIDAAYDEAMRLGAYGGKLCGAGGGGFLLFMAPDHVQAKMIETFGQKSFVKISLGGSRALGSSADNIEIYSSQVAAIAFIGTREKMTERALITGITGMVGSHLLDYLLRHTDWEIHGMLRWRSPLDNISGHLDDINAGGRIKLHYADLRDTMAIQNCVQAARPDYVFHLAAQSYPQTSFTAPLDTLDTNIQGTERLLGALRRFSPEAIIHVCASSEVFGRVPREKLPIDEECTFHPASPYAISKVGTDLVGRYYAEAYKMCVMTTRMFTHTGPRRGDVFAESTFAKQIAMIEGNKLPAGGEGRQSRFAAHLGGRPRRGARLSHARDRQPDAGRVLQYRRTVYLHHAGHARHADRAIDLRQHQGRGRSGAPAADRRRPASSRHDKVSHPHRLEPGDSV